MYPMVRLLEKGMVQSEQNIHSVSIMILAGAMCVTVIINYFNESNFNIATQITLTMLIYIMNIGEYRKGDLSGLGGMLFYLLIMVGLHSLILKLKHANN